MMHMKNLLPFILGIACCGWAPQAEAQDVVAPAPVEGPIVPHRKPRFVGFKNRSADLMERLLFRAYQTMPLPVESSEKFIRRIASGTPLIRGILASDLPYPETRVLPIEPRKEILLFGPADRVAQLEGLINYLDCPTPQVEIDVQFLRIDLEEAQVLGLKQDVVAASIVTADLGLALSRLVIEGKSERLEARRGEVTRTTLAALPDPLRFPDAVSTASEENIYSFLPSDILVGVTPIVEDEGTVVFQIGVGKPDFLHSRTRCWSLSREIKNVEFLSICQPKIGQTVAVTGLNPEIFPAVGNAKPSAIMVLFTPRLVADPAK
jgi:hypothetical protein